MDKKKEVWLPQQAKYIAHLQRKGLESCVKLPQGLVVLK